MSQPNPDGPIERWGLIFHGSGLYRVAHTRQDWACIADAIATADARLADAASAVMGPPPFARGDETWCTYAADTYQMLTVAGAYWHLRPGEDLVCAADEHIIRAYFGAPWVPPTNPPRTMLEASGWDNSFDPQYPVDPTSLVVLANHAQDLGLLGGWGHRVGLWRASERGEFTDAFLVTVKPWDQPGSASDRLSTHDLAPSGVGPVDAIVGVLTTVAKVANTLLATPASANILTTGPPDRQRDGPDPRLLAEVDGHPVGTRGHPFPPLNRLTPSTPDIPATPPPSPGSRRHR